ncbi:NAD-dependent epimerase/dehydratase family protein [Arenimonas sp.]|uniref:NAD-dependent epimerase/dehydratase family protein n=1 Tax=Arenimonas sp. TaxID=1872635 RepID=UPI0039E32B43
MRRWLVFGLSGMLGRAVAAQLPLDVEVDAPTRRSFAETPDARLHWRQASLADFVPDEAGYDAILSLGPLDLFADWYQAHAVRTSRIVAIGSCSLRFKADSPDPAERELAAGLQSAEDRLFALASQRGVAATVLRPTLVYGNGMDHSLTPMLEFARRWGVLPMPARAQGLRQPVHVDDVAQAVLASLEPQPGIGRLYELPGGEALALAAMLRRLARVRLPGARIVVLPNGLFRWGLRLGPWLRGRNLSAAGIVHRLGQDQTADPAPAHRDLGFSPRVFDP